MRFSSFKRSSSFFLVFGMAALLQACGSTNKEAVKAETKPVTTASIAAFPTGESDVAFCPQIQILEGTGVLTAYTEANNEVPDNISHQATIIQSGRQCRLTDGVFTLKVGTKGRAGRGPKAVGDAIILPIRVVVVKGEGQVLFSELVSQPFSFQGQNVRDFTLVKDNIVLPVDQVGEDVKVLVGFDTQAGVTS